MPHVTGLRESQGGRVAVELDGRRWRALPVEVVVRTRLAVGDELDRARLRELARELRRARGLEFALRALARRDLSSAALRRRLEGRRVPRPERDEAIGTLARSGLLDDERYAGRRAASLADRGVGNAAIRCRLEREGVAGPVVEAAVAGLEPERERARRLVHARGAGAGTARELARRGFGEDAIEEAVGPIADDL